MKLLLLMDADKSGKVSRAEFMAFMTSEFDRLDINHDGELDVKELEQSQLAVHRGGSHRQDLAISDSRAAQRLKLRKVDDHISTRGDRDALLGCR
jgi:Ca2+-binding EF-hand superfamily protein